MSLTLAELTARTATDGIVRWIGVRPARMAPMLVLTEVEIGVTGLAQDRRTRPGKRAVTLLQWEHLPVIAALSGREDVAPELLRRNIAVSGINLLALRARQFRVGSVELKGTGLCAPCSQMETLLGHGGYTAVRGHGGITAEVVAPGTCRVGDAVTPL